MNYPDHVKNFLEAQVDLGQELLVQNHSKYVNKDIIVVVHNQLECVKKCVESVLNSTKEKFTLWIWDNASEEDTANYLKEVAYQNNGKIKIIRSEENLGFIIPNNRLAEISGAEYLILLNSDCVVSPRWDSVMIGMLENHKDIAIVGYGGGLLDENGMGCSSASGYNVDFIMGWSLCMRREDYKILGLFDEQNLQFAYGEDSDLSLRAKEANQKIYAIRLNYVDHLGNQTTNEVAKKRDITTTFTNNHKYLQKKWAHYLEHQRILLKKS